MATVVLDHLMKRYGNQVAVNDLSLTVADGEFLVLVGPSGCGKTTALRCIAGLEDISGGRLLIDDRVVNDAPPKERDIAMVFQSYALYPHMTVRDNMAFGIRLRNLPKADVERRVREGAQILGLDPLLDRKPGQLSGGQRQRVALGRAIVREPAVFLMDEPLSNLDAKLRVQTRAEIARLHQRLGTTIIYVTHDQVEAMTMGDRIAVMKDGVLQQVGSPEALYNEPVNIFVAGFIGSPAMNFLTGSVRDEGGAATIRVGDVDIPVAAGASTRARALGADAKVTLGLRPEYLDVVSDGDDCVKFGASVDVVEFLGSQLLIHVTVADTDVVAVLPAERKVSVGDHLTLGAPNDQVHLFDPESGAALTG